MGVGASRAVGQGWHRLSSGTSGTSGRQDLGVDGYRGAYSRIG